MKIDKIDVIPFRVPMKEAIKFATGYLDAIEHNLRLGLSLAHHVFVLENGKISFESKATDLLGVEYAKKIYLAG